MKMKTLFLATLIVAQIAFVKSQLLLGVDPATLVCVQFLKDHVVPCSKMLVS